MAEAKQTFNTLVSASELADHLHDVHLVLVDGRFELSDPNAGRKAYLNGHIPGAVYAHLDDDLAGPVEHGGGRHPLPDWNVFKQTLGNWGIEARTQVVVYDQNHGAFAARLWWMLQALGHKAVAVLNGGFDGWVRAGLSLESGKVQNTPKGFAGDFDPNRIVSLEAVANNIGNPQFTLVDSRDGARYRGESEPIDPAAGHIPGAINHFFGHNLDENNQLFPTEALRTSFNNLLGGTPPQDAVFYCGSGVSACHNLLALAHAGLHGAKLYVGSWSEWASDPSRPIATGDQP